MQEAQEKIATQDATRCPRRKKRFLRQDIHAAAEALSMTVVPGQVLSDEAYYTQLGVFDQEQKALMLTLTDEALGKGAKQATLTPDSPLS